MPTATASRREQMNSRTHKTTGRARALCLSLLVAVAALATTAPLAQAGKIVDSFFPADGTPGTLGNQFNTPRDIAVNDSTVADAHDNWVYVVDSNNNRVQAFERLPSGEHVFRWAIGRDVIAPTASTDTDLGDVFEKCTTAADCKAGSVGTATDGPGGEFNGARSIAVDQQSGHLFVRERNPNLRIQEFTADGAFVRAFGWNVIAPTATTNTDLGDAFEVCTSSPDCQAATTSGSGGQAGQFGFVTTTGENDNGIAVVPATAPNGGNVIAADTANQRIMEFDPDAPTSSGVFVRAWGWSVDSATSQFEICTAASGCEAATEALSSGNGRFNFGFPADLGVDSRGIVYVGDTPSSSSPRIMRFDSSVPGESDGAGSAAAQMLLPFAGPAAFTPNALEVDPDSDGAGSDVDRLYLARNGTAGIEEYDASSATGTVTLLDTHAVGAGLGQNAIATNSTAGGGLLYITISNGVTDHRVFVLDSDGNTTPPDVTLNTPGPGDVTAETAHLTGTLNPGGFPAGYTFQYRRVGDTPWTGFGAEQSAGSGSSAVPIETTFTGLESNTAYEARIALKRGFGNGTVFSGSVSFQTEALAPTILAYPPNQRGCTSAALAAQVHPHGTPTTYFFEYGPTTAYGSSTPVASAGASGTPVEISEQIEGLDPASTYHYRLVAESSEGGATGDDMEFTTRAGCTLPDGRAFELVSPADDISGVGVGTWLPGDEGAHPLGMPSRSGERYVVKTTHGPTLLDGKFAYANDYAFAERTASGWISHSPFTRPNYGYAGNRFIDITAASDELSTLSWGSGSARTPFFPELEDWNVTPMQISDWQGHYEVFAPTDQAQGSPDPNTGRPLRVSADGTLVAATVSARNAFSALTGPDDPNLGRLPLARAVYVDDVSAGLSDTFPGDGVRQPVGVCDAGTQIPARIESSPGTFTQAEQACPVDGGLISEGGASMLAQSNGGELISDRNIVSADGSRVFFLSPDPNVAPSACSGTGAATSCPAQLFVREDSGAGATTRWISASTVPNQAASLMAQPYFEGATPDGDKVFFRSISPLTPDDPNGSCGAPCLTGAPDPESADLFMFDFTDSATDDTGAGELTRVSAGPNGSADGNVGSDNLASALRFFSDDASRLYFTSMAPLPGVPASDNGTITVPGGTRATTNMANLYLYDANRAEGDRYLFVARLPRGLGYDSLAACATTSVKQEGEPLNLASSRSGIGVEPFDCVHGSTDGALLEFMTPGRLVAGDPDANSADIYAYDAEADELERVSAPQGVSDASPYACVTTVANPASPTPPRCWGDTGFGGQGTAPLRRVAVTTTPTGAHSLFFQSKSTLLPEDNDNAYDVYEWHSGELSLLTPDTPTGAYFTGTSTDGQDVFFMTRDRLSWEDTDAVMDVYDARVGGGFPEPPPPPTPCEVLSGGCQPGANPPSASAPASATAPSAGNVTEKPRKPRKAKKRKGQGKAKKAKHASKSNAKQAKQTGRAGR
jgi:hypothetical protein